MFMNGDATTGERGAQLTALELPGLVGETHRVIAGDDTLVLQREDQVEILAPQRHESSALLTGRLTEPLVELLHILLPETTVGSSQSLELPRPQFRRQPILPSAKAAFTAAPGLWRIGRNSLNPQLSQSPSQ